MFKRDGERGIKTETETERQKERLCVYVCVYVCVCVFKRERKGNE